VSAVNRRLVQLSNLHVMLLALGDAPLTPARASAISGQCEVAQAEVEVAYKKAMLRFVRLLRKWMQQAGASSGTASRDEAASVGTMPDMLNLSMEDTRKVLESSLREEEARAVLSQAVADIEDPSIKWHARAGAT